MALGHRSTVASLFWIQGLVSYGEGLLTGRNFQWVTHLADASTRLDSLFKTPYTFVAAVTPISEADTSDFPVLRRGIAKYPQDWQMALSFSLRLAEGPTHDYQQAARIMEHFAHDTTVLPHVRTLHRSFYLRTQTTEMALMMLIDDYLNPQFKMFQKGLVMKTIRMLGKNAEYPGVKEWVQKMFFDLSNDSTTPENVFNELLKIIPQH